MRLPLKSECNKVSTLISITRHPIKLDDNAMKSSHFMVREDLSNSVETPFLSIIRLEEVPLLRRTSS